MSVAQRNLDTLPSAAWDAVDRLIDAFEQAWQSGSRPTLEDFLPADPSARSAAVRELVHVDLEQRLKAGEALRIEVYLEQHPELGADRRFLLGLVQAEYRHRRRRGTPPEPDEYHSRFPQLLPDLLQALQQEQSPATASDSPGDAPAVPFTSRAAGSRVGDYEILSVLGQGGMGVVYKAVHVRLKRTVALKMILAGAHAGAAACERFRIETEAAARLQHPNIVLIYEVGDCEGLPFFAMEVVEGLRLDQKLGGRPLAPAAAAELAETLTRAIHYAHERGVVHRDLKPANVLLAAGAGALGLPKISDFGLAKQLDVETGVTPPLGIMGTPSYMAPEQARGDGSRVGPSLDVYALGAVLYEMLTGRPPFSAATAWETILLVIHREPVPPSRLQPGCPRDLETICLKCLEKEPGRRYVSALEMAEDLGRFRAGEPIRARRAGLAERAVKWARRRPVVAALAAALLLAVAGGVTGMAALWVRAEIDRAAADRAKDTALRQQAAAEQSRRLAEERLRRLQLSAGTRLLEQGDLFGALPWFVAATDSAKDDAAAEEVNRRRIACVLGQCPRLRGLWPHRAAVSWAAISADGRLAVTAGAGREASLWDVQTGKLVREFAHDGEVVRAAFSPDGRLLVTASWDNQARVWEVASGAPCGLPLRHKKEVLHAVFSPDGHSVVTASADGTACVWAVEPGRGTPRILEHEAPVRHAAFSPDGRLLVTVGDDRMARVWDAASGKALHVLVHETPVTFAAFGGAGRLLVTVAEAEVRLWDVAGGRTACPVLRPGSAVHHAEISPDGRLLVTAGADHLARLWEVKTGQSVGLPLQHDAAVVHVAFSPDGRLLATASADHTARLWRVDTQRPAGPRLRHNGPVRQVVFSPTGDLLLTAGDDRTVRLWETTASGSPQLLHHDGAVRYAAFGAAGRLLVTVGDDGFARLWDGATGRPHTPAAFPHSSGVVHAAFNPDGTELVTAATDNSAHHWDVNTGTLRQPVLQQADEIRRVAFSPDGRLILTGGGDGIVRLWSAVTEKPIAELSHGGYILHAAFSPDGYRVVTTGTDRTARIWQVDQPDHPPLILSHSGDVLHASFSVDSTRLVTACSAGAAQVWDVNTGEALGEPLNHEKGVLYAEFSPDGRYIVTAGADGIAQLWHAEGGRASPPLKHDGPVRRAVFSADGRLIATASADHTARIWEASTGLPVTPRLHHDGEIWHIAFRPTGDRLVTATGDGSAFLWDIHADERSSSDLLLTARLLSGQQVAPGGAIEPLAAEELARLWQDARGRSLDEVTTRLGQRP